MGQLWTRRKIKKGTFLSEEQLQGTMATKRKRKRRGRRGSRTNIKTPKYKKTTIIALR
jgi:hypothetical protein